VIFQSYFFSSELRAGSLSERAQQASPMEINQPFRHHASHQDTDAPQYEHLLLKVLE
jgi:hypothetical protein